MCKEGFFSIDSICLSGHASTAAAANQHTGEQIYLISLRCCPGVQSRNFPNQVKVPPADNRFMGVLRANPFFGRLFVGFLLALQQNAGIGFFLQNADNRLCGPLGIRRIRKSALRVRQTPADLVGQGRRNTALIQFICNPLGTGPVNPAAVDVLHTTWAAYSSITR